MKQTYPKRKDISANADALNGFTEALRRAADECSGYEPSLSVLQRQAHEAADLMDALTCALAGAPSPVIGLLAANARGSAERQRALDDALRAVSRHVTDHLADMAEESSWLGAQP